jgi:hypothetical protein
MRYGGKKRNKCTSVSPVVCVSGTLTSTKYANTMTIGGVGEGGVGV